MTQKNDFVKSIDFSDLTPKMAIKQPEADPLYVKAFLDRDEKPASKYSQNTTTWD